MVLGIDKTPLYSSLYDRSKVAANLVPKNNSLEYRLSRFNRYRHVELETFHAENYRGHVFITKPELNLSNSSIKHDEILSTLITEVDLDRHDLSLANNEINTLNPTGFDSLDANRLVSQELKTTVVNSLPFSIKCNLDSRYFFDQIKKNNVQISTVINSYTPFIVPLYNAIEDISGYQDPVLETETRPTGFHQEDQTFALGYDDLVRSYDLSLTFNEIESDYISYMFYIWIIWMGLVRKGIVTTYPEAIKKRYLCYTCSIYRIITDSRDNKIKHWSKATGCFPKSVPYGNIFNMPSGEPYNTTTRQITIPFTSNKFEYDNPYILLDFNKLVSKYLKPVTKSTNEDDTTVYSTIGEYEGHTQLPIGSSLSHLGVPFIHSDDYGYTLRWLALSKDLEEYSKIRDEFS